MRINQSFYLAFEGNIGAGKTTLARKLAQEWGAGLVLEEFDDNPFLEKFYQDPQRHAFSVEMAFMADRYRQLRSLQHTEDLFQPGLIADYAPFKSLIFAQNNLAEDEFKLYRDFWEMSLGKLRRPDLIVYIHRPVERLQAQITHRGRSYEEAMPDQYLRSLSEAYQKYLAYYAEIPSLWIAAGGTDYLSDTKAWGLLKKQIVEHPVFKSQG